MTTPSPLPTADIINLIAGIAPGSTLDQLRDHRPEAKANAQASFEALFEPSTDRGFSFAERYAVALFIAVLHRDAQATTFYRDLLDDAAPAALGTLIVSFTSADNAGPYGEYASTALSGENAPGPVWHAPHHTLLDERLSAALEHAHLLTLHPRDARPHHLKALYEAGWSTDAIVSLSQLISFTSFQLRTAHGLRVLGNAQKGTPNVSI